MKCREIYDGLLRIEQGDTAVPPSLVDGLVRAGMLSVVLDFGDDGMELQGLKKELGEVVSERKKLAEDMDRAAPRDMKAPKPQKFGQMEARLNFLGEKARGLREKILKASAKPTRQECLEVSGRHVQITYAGREAMQNIGSRLDRVGNLEYDMFTGQMTAICAEFRLRAEKAKALLKILSPKLKGVDEIHLRAAAAGLSCIPADANKVARTFIGHHRQLKNKFHNENVVIAAEALTLMELNEGAPVDLGAVTGLVDTIYSTDYGKFDEGHTVERAATALYSSARGETGIVLEMMGKFDFVKRGTSICTLVLLGLECAEGEPVVDVANRFERFLTVVDESERGAEDKNDRTTAAALLTASELDFDLLVRKYRTANGMLDSLFMTRMDTAAAMIAVISQDVPETMDNIRLAAGEIMRARMSLSGLENFSLGLKVVLHTSALISVKPGAGATKKPQISPELLGLTVMLPLAAGIPFLVFHEELVHRKAVTHYRFHPVHSHYVYG